MPIEQTSTTSNTIEFMSPGSLKNHRHRQIDANPISTVIPAAEIAIRGHLPGNIQASDTLQYRQGVNTSSITPIS